MIKSDLIPKYSPQGSFGEKRVV